MQPLLCDLKVMAFKANSESICANWSYDGHSKFILCAGAYQPHRESFLKLYLNLGPGAVKFMLSNASNSSRWRFIHCSILRAIS